MNTAAALERAFREERPLRVFIAPGLALSYQPRERLTIGRVSRQLDDDDIALAVEMAREAFIILAHEPERDTIELNGVTWHLAWWNLRRESVVGHLPLKKERVR
jgi:hypothetical protein